MSLKTKRMKKHRLFLGYILVIMVFNNYADETHPGSVASTYGTIVKSSYGECVRTTYYDASFGVKECGEAVPKPTVKLQAVEASHVMSSGMKTELPQ